MTSGVGDRVIMAGLGGSGKTTIARRIALIAGLPLTVLDDIYYGPGLTPRADFEDHVREITDGPRWIFDSQGAALDAAGPRPHHELLWSRAQTLVWLDYPRRVVVRRAATRSIRRIVTREELWAGYRETWRGLLSPSHPVRRGCARHASRRAQLELRSADPQWQPLTVIRLLSPAQAERWLAALAVTAAG